MITDARVLQPETIPREVKHRDAEVNHLTSVLNPIVDGQPADPMFLHGPSGVGKTCIAQYSVERLRENMVNLNHQYVNCWEDYNRFKVLYRLLEAIGETLDIHRQSTPTDVLLDRLRDYDGPPFVAILDEVDQLEDKELLYDLHRIRGLTMILIANTEESFFSSLDHRLNSRLTSCARIHFRSYHDAELVSILEDRVRWGLEPDVIDRPQLQTIANSAAGDARVAIGVLRKAARTAQENGLEEITEQAIQRVVPEAKSEIKQKTVDRLNPHQRALYDIIIEHNRIEPTPLYEAYADHVDDPRSRRMVRNYLSKLEHYNLITTEGSTKDRVYHARS